MVVVYMGRVLFAFFSSRSIQYSCLFLNKTFYVQTKDSLLTSYVAKHTPAISLLNFAQSQ